MSQKFFFKVCLLLVATSSCDKDDVVKPRSYTFEYSGLDGMIVNEISISLDGIITATDHGLFMKDTDLETWESIGLSGKNIRTFVEIDSDLWLAAENTLNSFHLFKSENQGGEWIDLENDFGGMYEQHINDLEYDAETQILYAVGHAVLAKSSDNGSTWVPIIGDWDLLASGLDFVEKNPGSEELWTGGQNAIEGFVLYKYDLADGSETFYPSLVDAPSTAKSILFNPGNANEVIIGAESGIIKTTNGGDSWTFVKEDHETSKFTFGLVRDEFSSNLIYSAGWLKDFDNPQKLILSVSPDNGSTWTDITYPDDELFGGVFDMIGTIEDGKQVLYLGLFKGGAYKVIIER